MHRTIEDLSPINAKCPRCSLCKFPPLMRLESQEFSLICPSHREFAFHSHSGGGRVVMAIAHSQGRAQISGEAKKAVFACTLCGGCDTACKFSSDIEILEMMYALRAKCFETVGPLPGHKAALERMEKNGHALTVHGKKGDWVREAGLNPSPPGAETLLFAGDRYALLPEKRKTIQNLARLLKAGGLGFKVLGDAEPSTGRPALDMGDRERFDAMARLAVDAVRKSGAKTVILADPLDYNAFVAHAPKCADTEGIRFVPAVEALWGLVKSKKLKPRTPVNRAAAYHDPCTLGRLAEPFRPWNGEIKKILGQLVIYDPPRPVNRGAEGFYEAPRKILSRIPGLSLTEFYRRKEYAFCCGGEGMAREAGFTEFVENTAAHRMDEAKAVGADLVVTACPNCVSNLTAAGENKGIAAIDIIDILARSVFGN